MIQISRFAAAILFAALLPSSSFAQRFWATPDGSSVGGTITMCLNGSSKAIPCAPSGGGGSGGDASAANQTSQITQETATNTVLGAKTDAKSTATDGTSISFMQVMKQISASVQAPPSQAVTNAGTFAAQAAQSGTWTVQPGNTANTTAWKVDGSAVTQPVSIASVPSHAVTNAGTFAVQETSAAAAAASLAIVDDVGAGVSVTLTRTSDTNAYAANDVIGAATGSTAAINFASVGPSGREVMLTSASLKINATAIISGETSYNLYCYPVTPPSALGDNVAFDIPSGDQATAIYKIPLGAPVDEGSTLLVQTDAINKQITLSSTGIFCYLVTVGAHTPTSARVYVVNLHFVPM